MTGISINTFNTNTLIEVEKLSMHDFGIFLELAPDTEEKQLLENNIQVALAQKQIELEDAIDAVSYTHLRAHET